MLFTEPIFLFVFLPVLLALVYTPGLAVLIPRRRTVSARLTAHQAPRLVHGAYANWLLLLGSLVFYAKGGGAFTWLMLGSIAFNYSMAIAVDRARASSETRARAWLAAAVVINLVVLGVFKYANFIADNANLALEALRMPPIPLRQILLPIGISFFSFHAISYVVDVYRRDAAAQKSPVHAALYLLLFPQLIAGPIIRYRDIADQLASRTMTLDGFALGVRRFVIGLGKKVLIANTVAITADQLFGPQPGGVTTWQAWLGVVCYTLQIYFDFSGYSDMAIGLGAMFGFRFPENFRWPYSAVSVQDFWRRWHMSLSSWFRDYVYIPLGGSRASPMRTYVNLVAVFFLCGLWHGASWTFVFWGLFHGAFLVVERLGGARLLNGLPMLVRRTYTLLVVMVGWVFFRSDSFGQALTFLRAMAGFDGHATSAFTPAWYLTPDLQLALLAGVIGSMPVMTALARWAEEGAPSGAPQLVQRLSVVALTLVLGASILSLAARTYNPFIYFRF